MSSKLLGELNDLIRPWARTRGLEVSLIGSELAGGLAVNATLLPKGAYASFYTEHAERLGYPTDALGSELVLESGQCVVVAGLDPVAEHPELIVHSNGQYWHLSRGLFEAAWATKEAD